MFMDKLIGVVNKHAPRKQSGVVVHFGWTMNSLMKSLML